MAAIAPINIFLFIFAGPPASKTIVALLTCCGIFVVEILFMLVKGIMHQGHLLGFCPLLFFPHSLKPPFNLFSGLCFIPHCRCFVYAHYLAYFGKCVVVHPKPYNLFFPFSKSAPFGNFNYLPSDVPKTKVCNNLDRYGNTSSGSIPLVLDEVYRQGRVKPGDLLLLSGFGAGLIWATVLLRW